MINWPYYKSESVESNDIRDIIFIRHENVLGDLRVRSSPYPVDKDLLYSPDFLSIGKVPRVVRIIRNDSAIEDLCIIYTFRPKYFSYRYRFWCKSMDTVGESFAGLAKRRTLRPFGNVSVKVSACSTVGASVTTGTCSRRKSVEEHEEKLAEWWSR